MRRHAAVVVTAIAGALALAAPASAVRLGPGSETGSAAVAAGPDGGAQVAWLARTATGARVGAADLAPQGGFGPVRSVIEAPAVGAMFAWLQPGGGAGALVTTGTAANIPTDLVDLRRAPGAPAYGPPLRLANGTFASIVAGAANARGDVAAVVSTTTRHEALLTAARGGPFGPPQDLSADGGFAEAGAVAVGPQGEVVVAYYDGVSRGLARQGSIGAPLGPPQRLGQVRERLAFAAAIDDAGTGTVALTRDAGRNEIALAVARAPRGGAFGAPATLARGQVALESLAAGGSTTAIAWSRLSNPTETRVAVARGPGAFGRGQDPTAAPTRIAGAPGRQFAQASTARLAVDPAGDVLLGYRYGPFGAVHAAIRRAADARFRTPRVLSALGHGGTPAVGLTRAGRPVVAFADRSGIFAATALGGFPVDRRPPRVTLTAPSAADLRASGRVRVTVRCSTRCLLEAHARLTTGRGRSGPGRQVISRQQRTPFVPGGATRIEFDLPRAARAAFERTGRAQVHIGVTAAGVTGAASAARRTLELGA